MRFHLYLPVDLAEKLIVIAAQEYRNPRQQAERFLKEAIEQAAQTTKPGKEHVCVSEE